MRKYVYWLIGTGAILSFIIRLIALNQTPFANGWDTYFYLIQIQSLVETGSMHSQEWTLLYPLLFLCSMAFNYVLAIKILSAFLAANFTLFLALIGWQQTKSFWAAVLIIAIVLFSPELTYFTAQWPKNLLGLDLLLVMFFFLSKEQFKWALLFLLLGFFGHRLTAVLSLLLFLGWYIYQFFNPKRILYGIIPIILVVGTIHFIPGLINWQDIIRLKGLMGARLSIAPRSFLLLFGTQKVSFLWQFELWIWYALFFYLGGKIVYDLIMQRPTKAMILVFVLLLILWFPLYNFTMEGAAYRLFHSGVLLAMLIPLFLIRERFDMNLLVVGVTSVLLVIASFFSYRAYNPTHQDPPYKMYAGLTKEIKQIWLTKGKPVLIIAHKALAEYITYNTRVDVLPWLPEYKVEEENLYRIAYFPYRQLASYYLEEKVVFLSTSYGYLKESDWQIFMNQLRANESKAIIQAHSAWTNPSAIRPLYLLKN